MKKIIFSVIIICLFSVQALKSQPWKHGKHFLFFDKPTIEVSYGTAFTGLDGLISKIENSGMFDVKLGYSSVRKYHNRNDALIYEYGYLTGGGFSPDMYIGSKTASNLKSDLWRIGLGFKSGFQTGSRDVSFLPFTSSNMVWSRLNLKTFPDSSNMYDIKRLDMYNKSVRFGINFEGGLDITFSNSFSCILAYDRTLVFQRCLFLKNSMSLLIQELGSGLIKHFSMEVFRENPVAGSIVNFALRNAYLFLFYQLRSKEMNFPFGGEPSLDYQAFKIGVKFRF